MAKKFILKRKPVKGLDKKSRLERKYGVEIVPVDQKANMANQQRKVKYFFVKNIGKTSHQSKDYQTLDDIEKVLEDMYGG